MSTATVKNSIDWAGTIFGKGQRAGDLPVRLIGVRGWAEGDAAKNQRGLYDDLIVRIIGNTVDFWKASLDPTPALTRNPINPDGAAMLMPGIHLFALGIHKGNPKWPCFVQAENFHIWRLDGTGKPVGIQCGEFGIHLHSGGAGDDTGRFSAGCQILWNPDGYWGQTWFDFFNPLRDAMKAHCQAVLPYRLMEAQELPAATAA